LSYRTFIVNQRSATDHLSDVITHPRYDATIQEKKDRLYPRQNDIYIYISECIQQPCYLFISASNSVHRQQIRIVVTCRGFIFRTRHSFDECLFTCYVMDRIVCMYRLYYPSCIAIYMYIYICTSSHHRKRHRQLLKRVDDGYIHINTVFLLPSY
jgi:hypothetical protein